MFKICCLFDFDHTATLRNPGATFYVQMESFAFPDSEWYDLPLSVLDMWCWNLIENFKSLTAEFTLYFMDGPYLIRCIKDNGNVTMQFIDNHKDDERVILQREITFSELKYGIYDGACELISVLSTQKNVESTVFRSLEKRVKKLKKIIK